jgi:serine/threonine-protein kinase
LSRSSPPSTPADAGGPRLFPATVPIPEGWLEAPGGAGPPVRILAFDLGRTPVTNREYAPFLAEGRVATPPWWNDERFARPRQPVVGVSWEDAVAFGDWLTEAAAGAGRWRLPTEAVWEHAVRGGRAAPPTPWGDAVPDGEIPEGRLEAPWDTGLGTPNGYGLLDPGTMVHEWCLNWSAGVPGHSGPPRRASRGGSWRHAIRFSAPGASSSLPPGFRYSDYGFRLLRERTPFSP